MNIVRNWKSNCSQALQSDMYMYKAQSVQAYCRLGATS